MTFPRILPSTHYRNALIGALTLTVSAEAMAQVAVDPAQVEKRFDQPTASTSRAPGVSVTVPSTSLTPAKRAQLSKKHFVLDSISIEGNTAFSDAELTADYQDMVGKKVSMLDAHNIVSSITSTYRAHGYILSDAKLQNVSGGTLNIQVREGHINNITFAGDIGDSSLRSVTQDYADYLKSLRPVKNTDIERFLLLLDDLSGATAKGAVRATNSATGAADLSVVMSHTPFEGSYSIDNRGSKFIGPWQHTATLAANSLFGLYDRTVLRGITTSPASELKFVDLTHEQPIGSNGTIAGFIASYSKTKPGDSFNASDIEADSNYFEAHISHPFLRSRKETFTGRFTFDVRNTTIDTAGVTTSKDHLRVARLGATYDFSDDFDGANILDVQVSQGLDAFGASKNADPASRANTDGSFTKFNFDVARTQYLPFNGFSLFASASGQYATDQLLAAEQFAIGGATYGRGYNPTELSGDHAITGKIEMRYTEVPGQEYMQAYQLYGFYDIGRTWLKDTLNGDDSLSSAGVGIRANITEVFAANFEIAMPLTKDVSNEGRHGDDPRFFFEASASF
ncbi:MAG: ShlB/FhaC/HecB family hemolysin secretion/activation protein [Rickettsiales bacterium]